MSNYQGRKPDFIPAVYTRYFERSETPKTSSGHIYFNEDNDEKSSNYQIKRDLIFKRLFPSKFAQSDNDQSEADQNQPNRTANSSNPAQALGDFIPLSNTKKQSSPDIDEVRSSSDETDEDLLIEAQLPTIAHESIVGHLHPRSTIENVRAILIRELYERTSDSNTEWLKCKMELPREYINPKYFADFQRRYRKDIQKHGTRKKKSNLVKNKTDNGYNAFNLTKQMDVKIENDDIIEISSKKAVKTTSSSSPIILSNSTSSESKSPPEFIVVDTDDEDNDDHLNTNENSSYFIDRSSTSFTAVSQPIVQTSTDDYHKEDSKYAQLPSRSTSSSTIIRPIISKHQRRKQSQIKDSSKPLVSAIDRIIDQMDQSNTLNDSNTMEEQNLLIKQIKKRKKKKKKSVTTN